MNLKVNNLCPFTTLVRHYVVKPTGKQSKAIHMIKTRQAIVKKLAGFLLVMVALLASLSFSNPSYAQQDDQSQDSAAVDQIASEVVRRLVEDGTLSEQIKLGIQRYIEEQRQAQANAQANARNQQSAKAKNVRRVDRSRDHIYGNEDALITLIEYSDFECPYCKRFHPTARQLVDQSGGKVNWVYRHFPLAFHNPLAQQEAEASECAGMLGGNEAFWRYTDLVYERTNSNGKGLSPDSLAPFAGEIGLDEEKFSNCLSSGRMTARVLEDYREGTQIGISGTPGNIILNNETGEVEAAAGALPISTLQQIIDRLSASSS